MKNMQASEFNINTVFLTEILVIRKLKQAVRRFFDIDVN